MHDVPPHILHEIMDLKEKVGRLEGMVEVLLHSKHGHCECPECKGEK
jgi:tetrahydromethanopterin S-methyltransferase subunit B